MISRDNAAENRRHVRILVLLLTAAFLITLAIPSFAVNEEAAPPDSEESIETVQEEMTQIEEAQAEESPEAGSEEENADEENEMLNEEDVQTVEETDQAEQTEAEKTQTSDEEKEPAEKPEVIKLKVPKAKLAGSGSSDEGKKVSYTGTKAGAAAGETSIFKVTTGGTTYTGTCAEQGVAMKSSGTATITKISNSKKIAKVVYHFAYELGDDNWWTSEKKDDKVGKILGMNNDSDANVTKRRMVEAFCQLYNMGTTDWYKTITSQNSGGWSTDTADRVRDYYTGINDRDWYKNSTVPEGFEIWYADAGNDQPFMIWAYTPTGYAAMKKVSGNTSITD